MTKQVIDTSTPQPNGKQGEPIRTAFEKAQGNFDELYARTGGNASLPGSTTALLTSDKQANLTDTAAGKLLTVGSFGIGAPIDLGTAALNSILTPGTYRQSASANATEARNYPIVNSGVLSVELSVISGTTGIHQTYHSLATNRVFIRTFAAAIWSDWSEIAKVVPVDTNRIFSIKVGTEQSISTNVITRVRYDTVVTPGPGAVSSGGFINVTRSGWYICSFFLFISAAGARGRMSIVAGGVDQTTLDITGTSVGRLTATYPVYLTPSITLQCDVLSNGTAASINPSSTAILALILPDA